MSQGDEAVRRVRKKASAIPKTRAASKQNGHGTPQNKQKEHQQTAPRRDTACRVRKDSAQQCANGCHILVGTRYAVSAKTLHCSVNSCYIFVGTRHAVSAKNATQRQRLVLCLWMHGTPCPLYCSAVFNLYTLSGLFFFKSFFSVLSSRERTKTPGTQLRKSLKVLVRTTSLTTPPYRIPCGANCVCTTHDYMLAVLSICKQIREL